MLVINAGPVPENAGGPLRRFGPDLVVLVDAAEMDEVPGAVRWFAPSDATGVSASTHTLPPYLIAEYLAASLDCEVALIGIQPEGNALGDRLSPPVRKAVRSVVAGLKKVLRSESERRAIKTESSR
jgi:hydrogenase 3 maturation protease